MQKIKESDIKLVVPYVDPISLQTFGIWTNNKVYTYVNNWDEFKSYILDYVDQQIEICDVEIEKL